MPWITEDRARVIEAAYKIVASLAIVGAGIWTVAVYSVDLQQRTEISTYEVRRPFLEKRMEYYLEMTTATSAIVASKDPKVIAAARDKFWQLYYGPWAVVQEPLYGVSADEFAACLDAGQKCTSLKQLAINVAASSRQSLAPWSIIAPGPPQNLTITFANQPNAPSAPTGLKTQ